MHTPFLSSHVTFPPLGSKYKQDSTRHFPYTNWLSFYYWDTFNIVQVSLALLIPHAGERRSIKHTIKISFELSCLRNPNLVTHLNICGIVWAYL